MSHVAELREVTENAARLAGAGGRGILASDESTGTVGKRLHAVGLENSAEMRRAYREVLYTTPGLGQYISGAILFPETLYQSTAEGVPFVEVLAKEGVLVGVKVDQGLVVLPGTDGETMTAGIDGLAERCSEYYKQGARFAKWRAVIKISNECPTAGAIAETAEGLARYAAICQKGGLVPVVEPEVLIDGSHTIERSAEVAEIVLSAVIAALIQHKVCLEGILIKPQMVLPGFDPPRGAAPREQSAALTVRALQRTVPAAVPGVMFLSGGQSEEEATEHLNALNVLKSTLGDKAPWSLSFSFGRALQASVLRIWGGAAANREPAQRMALGLARANSKAVLGQYEGPHPSTCTDDLREGFRGWRT